MSVLILLIPVLLILLVLVLLILLILLILLVLLILILLVLLIFLIIVTHCVSSFLWDETIISRKLRFILQIELQKMTKNDFCSCIRGAGRSDGIYACSDTASSFRFSHLVLMMRAMYTHGVSRRDVKI